MAIGNLFKSADELGLPQEQQQTTFAEAVKEEPQFFPRPSQQSSQPLRRVEEPIDVEEHFISFYQSAKRLLGSKAKNLKINMTDGEIIIRLARDMV